MDDAIEVKANIDSVWTGFYESGSTADILQSLAQYNKSLATAPEPDKFYAKTYCDLTRSDS